MTKKSDAKVFRPGTQVEVGGSQYVVRPLTLDEIIDASELLSKIAEDVRTASWVQILKTRRQDLYHLIAQTAGVTPEELGSLPASEAWKIINVFVEENKSFFTDQLIPFLASAVALIQPMASAGDESSPSSGPTATPGQPAES